MKNNEVYIENAPNLEGLSFRKFAGESDYPEMVKIVDVTSKADKEEVAETLEDIKHNYAHLTNSDPSTDMLFAEINGETIAYSRVEWWQEENPNDRIYSHFVNIHPEWRSQGIENTMIRWCENRLKAIASKHPQDGQFFFHTYSNAFKLAFNEILESLDYKAVRYFIEMSRSLENIPTAKLPEGIEVRPVQKEDIRKVWDAANDAFRDHWGYSKPKEEHFIEYQGSKFFQPELWQVAWESDKVVASVMNYIEHDYNKKFHRKRGWTENISTRKAWRRRGIARALIIRSMHMHKEKGMTEVGLGVDTDNPNGALKLYQDLGYVKNKTWITYRKPMRQ
jgi:mycothiol synthase